jgi:hypothetical protein
VQPCLRATRHCQRRLACSPNEAARRHSIRGICLHMWLVKETMVGDSVLMLVPQEPTLTCWIMTAPHHCTW